MAAVLNTSPWAGRARDRDLLALRLLLPPRSLEHCTLGDYQLDRQLLLAKPRLSAML